MQFFLNSEKDLKTGVDWLRQQDAALSEVYRIAGPPSLRRYEACLPGLARIIVGQQVSVHAAAAIWKRVEKKVRPFNVKKLGRTRDSTLLKCGLSSSKVRTFRAITKAVENKSLCFNELETYPAKEAMECLCRIKGIGPWTAEIYLMFCLGHPDIWPAGDIALQWAVKDALDLEERPTAKETIVIAERWEPYRSVAACMLWRYYATVRMPKSGAPI